ncbi:MULTISPECIES: hypothetical protein [Cellulophaga]|jgi:hypothetical protein|uniref:Uncharacterized protein n=3 Tax=Flavobacteriaceae TaxID=49546 RepID=A0A1G7G5F3_9FLAO|nr:MULTISPECIES: hypothetical protein [Cellulophaga]AIY14766.1 hypothetical protein M667_17210 [Cellulophaga baltica NN016038]WFO16386.1 hypothetical protein M601_000710 [Cellulophaga baltica 4]AIZ43140.1 hypothetical protein M666_17225 [Cellulophaga baltica 18]KGK31539.1 hypothetical protein EL45_04020 [Cellulophaga sp. E6(2014)]MBA6315578.1 hypothetical protein [Cellulophaga baltica]
MFKTVDRLMQFIKHAGMSARQFDLSIGASNGYTLRMLKNNASIGSDVIENIVATYPNLNLVWLITGEGEMLKSDANSLNFNQLPKEKQSEIEQIIERKIRERQERELRSLLKDVTDEINAMEDKN